MLCFLIDMNDRIIRYGFFSAESRGENCWMRTLEGDLAKAKILRFSQDKAFARFDSSCSTVLNARIITLPISSRLCRKVITGISGFE